MAETKNSWCNNQRTPAIIMASVGLLIWILADSQTEVARTLVPGLGFFLFIYGVSTINQNKEWCKLAPRQKMTKIFLAVGLGALVAIAVAFFLVFSSKLEIRG